MKPYVLITGATGGIGSALCRVFASRGYPLIISARNYDKLFALSDELSHYGAEVASVPADLSRPDGAVSLYNGVISLGLNVGILINNAGIGVSGEAQKVSKEREEELINVNITSATVLTKLFLSDMYKSGEGRILNVCSVGAFQPGPYTASYYASKSYLYSYTLAVRYEAKKHGITVCALCPGPVDTDFFAAASAKKPKHSMKPDKVALSAYKGLMKGRAVIVPGLSNKLARLITTKIKTAFVAALKRK